MTRTEDAPPARAPWPPIFIAATLAAGMSLDAATGHALTTLVSFPYAGMLGGLIVALALANEIWCATIFARLKTTILPHRAASHLATQGPFRWSRNPIYVSHVAVVAGLALLLSSPFTLLLTPLLAYGLTTYAIMPEERHLLRKFGAEYQAYMARTRRWL